MGDIAHQIGSWLWQVIVPTASSALVVALFALARTYIAKIADERLRDLIMELVAAAEQIYGSGRGAEKKKFVLEELADRGAIRDPALIEAAVRRLFPNFPDPATDADGE